MGLGWYHGLRGRRQCCWAWAEAVSGDAGFRAEAVASG